MTLRMLPLAALALALLAAPLTADAQSPSKVPRIGYLSPALDTSLLAALRQGLRDLGWVEGQNIAIEARSAEGKYERLPELAAELVRLKVDVIFASTTPAALAAKHATTTILIVIGFVADPDVPGAGRPDHNSRRTEPAAGDVRRHGAGEGRWSHGLWG